jgi:hypothetical protein
MSDRSGQARALTTFVPIVPGREAGLDAHLKAFPRGAGSPLAGSPRTHVARWVIIDRLPTRKVDRPDYLRRNHLLFSASFDGDETSYLVGLTAHLGSEVEAIWGNCEGFPPGATGERFATWLLTHRVRNTFFFSAYPHATLADVRNALAAREQALAFALRAQSLDPAERLRTFREQFP